jgi:hypothetical protein
MTKHFNPNRTVAAGKGIETAQQSRVAHQRSGHFVSEIEWNDTIGQYTYEIDTEVRPEHSLATALRNITPKDSPAAKLQSRIVMVEGELARKQEELVRLASDYPLSLSTINSQIESIALSQGRLRGLMEAQRLYSH